MDLHDREVLAYLRDLIVKDLANHYQGNPKSLMAGDYSEFTLSPENIKFRRELIKHIINKQLDPGLRPISRSGITINNWHLKLNAGVITNIADHLGEGRKIQAIKELREATGFGLKEAKDIINSFLDSNRTLPIDRFKAKREFLKKCGGPVPNIISSWKQ
jgi:hypothetical protein